MIAGCSCDLPAGTETTCTRGRAGGFLLPSSAAGVQCLGGVAYMKERFNHQRNGGLYSFPGGELRASLS